MYYYIFDAPRGPQDYQRIAQIKERLSQLGIAGEMSSPMPGKEVPYLVENALGKRYGTIVAVGGSELMNQVAAAIIGHDVALGLIPLHEHADIAQLTGMQGLEHACEQLKKRRWQTVWLGQIEGNGCFLTPARVELPTQKAIELSTKDFKLEATGIQLTITPQQGDGSTCELRVELQHTAQDEKSKGGFFGSLFGSKDSATPPTRFQTANLEVQTQEPLPITVAGNTLYQTPARFTIASKPIRLIVARHGTAPA